MSPRRILVKQLTAAFNDRGEGPRYAKAIISEKFTIGEISALVAGHRCAARKRVKRMV
jgi:hypothetical protein